MLLVGAFNQEKDLLCKCETSNFAKVCFQLYLALLGGQQEGAQEADAAEGGVGEELVLLLVEGQVAREEGAEVLQQVRHAHPQTAQTGQRQT